MTTPAISAPTPVVTATSRLKVFNSMRLEILISLAMLGATALVIAVFTVLLLDRVVASRFGAVVLALMIIADVLIFVGFGAYKLQGLVLDPLQEVVDTTEAIAAGDLSRRVPSGTSSEFRRLARSVNHMTASLLEEQARRAHLEKMASVGTLAAGVAHEIGNPLGAITGYAHLLRHGLNGDAEAADALNGIERESARIDRIVRGMLEYARPRRRTAALVDLNASVRRAMDTLTAQRKLDGLEVHLDLASGLPRLVGDVYEMDQVIVNLLLNAADAMGHAGQIGIVTERIPFPAMPRDPARRSTDPFGMAVPRAPSARVRAWLNTVGEPAEVIKVIVSDSGPGVPASETERIFDPFFTTKPPGQGTGLGLSIVARVVEGLGGTVWVRPAREGGAAFMMMFPVPDGPPVIPTGSRWAAPPQ
ncbi:MAG TPA: HAMP domain-containing sensor histidine kinase [Gemmatimonadaceae bacterium]|nr:HAMP domain-containing sensor histidine kinase [Gemmatimonadaceae bacterium]